MKISIRLPIAGLLLLAAAVASAGDRGPRTGYNQLFEAVDLNPDPDVVEIDLVAAVKSVDLSGDGLMANAWTFNGGTPGPLIRLRVGQRLIVHFRNELPKPNVVHWHGIELDNANDGTEVTQNPVPPGETFTYDFVVPRPGVFFYHPHSMPSNDEFKGLYGPIIVTSTADEKLGEIGIVPPASDAHVLVLADTTVCKEPGQNDEVTYKPGADVSWVHQAELGDFPGLVAWPSPRDLCETPRDDMGNPLDGALAKGDIPNIKPSLKCAFGDHCRVNEGQLVLTNGRMAAGRLGTPEKPGALIDETAEVVDIESGGPVRLQLINAAVNRYFWLRLTDSAGNDIPLLRIGGEGGLLDRVRIEGGMMGKLDTKYRQGEILLANANRADIVFNVPDLEPGEVLTLWTQDYQRYGTQTYPYGYGGLPTVPVAHFRVRGAAGRETRTLAEGDPLRIHRKVGSPVASIKDHSALATFLDPAEMEPPRPGMSSNVFQLNVIQMREAMDGYHATIPPDETGDRDHRDIPYLNSSRFAEVGGMLEIEIANLSQAHHPMHLHGFSFQPVRIVFNNSFQGETETVYEHSYNEFVDTIDIPPFHTAVVRVPLEDRPKSDGSPGGALGRWLFHCHIFHHAAVGMLTEIVVVDGPSEEPLASTQTDDDAVALSK
ncbi:MAG: multicopper oxidase domain-containing protein [Gammaproteobacteria bacterium]|jgi:FtsP/CotA-like multicopper oxidase with cupredoxin domain|nr:multicopper oxidase domain-containing protein [Gammaproteobacteria bacterium]